MRKAVLYFSCVFALSSALSGCALTQQPAPQPPAVGASDADLMAVMKDWLAAFNAHDSGRLLKLYAPDADLIVGPRSGEIDRMRHYIGAVKEHTNLSGEWVGEWMYDHHEDSHVGVIDRNLRVTDLTNGQTASRVIRFVMLIAYREGRWQIVAHVMLEPIWPIPQRS